MNYTIKIDSTTEQAQSILNMLLELAKDYDFLEVYKETENKELHLLTPEQEKELDRRFEYVLQNMTVGKTWEDIERKLLTS